MSEEKVSSPLEAEIAELSKRIEEKRRQINEANGLIEEKDLVKSAIAEMSAEVAPGAASVPAADVKEVPKESVPTKTISGQKTYLASLPSEIKTRVDELIAEVYSHGLRKTLAKVMMESPAVMDSFHDMVADVAQKEMKEKNLI